MSHKPHDGKPVDATSIAGAFAAKKAREAGEPVDPALAQHVDRVPAPPGTHATRLTESRLVDQAGGVGRFKE